MNRRVWVVSTLAVLSLGSLIGYRHVASIAAEPVASAGGSVPPEIIKGTVIEFVQPAYPVHAKMYYHPTVEQVHGNWVLFEWVPNELGKPQGYQSTTFWVNFDTVNAFRVARAPKVEPKPEKTGGQKTERKSPPKQPD